MLKKLKKWIVCVLYNLALCWEYGGKFLGFPVKQNQKKAKWLYKNLYLIAKDRNSQFKYACFLINGNYSEKQDALSLFLEIENVDSRAKCNAGFLFSQKGCFEEAFLRYTEAAKEGNLIAKYNLGRVYLAGSVVEKDKKKALEWLLDARTQLLQSSQDYLEKENFTLDDIEEAIFRSES
jgi:TPR repeat protein